MLFIVADQYVRIWEAIILIGCYLVYFVATVKSEALTVWVMDQVHQDLSKAPRGKKTNGRRESIR